MSWKCLCGAELDDSVEFCEHPDGLEDITLRFACCFCGEEVDDPFSLTLGHVDGAQTWWCHKDCFVESIHQDARTFWWDDEP